MRIVANKHWQVYLDFGRAGSLSLQLYWTYHRLLHLLVAMKSHALPVYKKNKIASLLCIFETTIASNHIWAVTCDFQQCGILTSVDPDQPVQSPVKLSNSKCCSVSILTVIDIWTTDKGSDQTAHMLVEYTTLLEISCHGSFDHYVNCHILHVII